MNNNSKVLPNFIKSFAVILIAAFSSTSFAEPAAMPEVSTDISLENNETVQTEDVSLEIAPLSEEELKIKAEKERRMNHMKELMSKEPKPVTPE